MSTSSRFMSRLRVSAVSLLPWVFLTALLLPGAQVFRPPAALNSNASADSGDDIYPKVVTDGAGNWVAVWDSADTLGTTIAGRPT